MYRLRVLKQVRMAYLPAVAVGASASAAVAVSSLINSVSAAAKPPPPPPPTDCDLDKKLIRAKDLSIYVSPAPATEENPLCKKTAAKEDPDDRLMDLVRATRKELWKAKEEFDKEVENLGKQVEAILETGKSHLDSSLQTLRDPENATYRYAAIAGGGLFGLILSLRRGIFKKLTYTTTGALAMAALCYPEEAQEISEEVLNTLAEYTAIAYHFANAGLEEGGSSDAKHVTNFSKPTPKLTALFDYENTVFNLINMFKEAESDDSLNDDYFNESYSDIKDGNLSNPPVDPSSAKIPCTSSTDHVTKS